MSPPDLHRRPFLPLLLQGPRDATLPEPRGATDFSPQLFLARWLEGIQPGLGLAKEVATGRAEDLRLAYQNLGAAQRNGLEERVGKSFLQELLSLAAESDPTSFFEGLYGLAGREEAAGRRPLAAALYSGILAAPQAAALHPRARSRLDGLSGRGNFGSRAESFLQETVTLDNVAGGVSHAGALLGLATIACSLIRPLRPLAAGGVHLLSHPTVAGTLLASGGFLLARQAPEAWAAGRRLFSDQAPDGMYSSFEDGLLLSGWILGAVGVGVGLNSFGFGASTFRSARQAALAQGFSSSEATAVAAIRADAVRRAVQDPEIWVAYARSAQGLRPWQRLLLSGAGQWTGRGLLYGSAAVGVGRFGLGLQRYLGGADPSVRGGEARGLSGLFLAFAMDVSPAVTVHLYRAGRGNRDYNLGPVMSQELTERHYQDPILRQIVLERIDRGVPSLAPAIERAFIRQLETDLLWVQRALRRAQGLTRVAPKRSRNLGEFQGMFGAAPAEIPAAPAPVTFHEDARWLNLEARQAFAGMNLRGIRNAYAEGRVSPVAAVQALIEHPEAGNGAIFPRSISSGPYRSRLMSMAEESRRRFERGEARPLEGVLIGVKDLFSGADGQMMLGSKTARVTGVEASPVVSTLLELGAIPVPVGMVAAANGGSGLNAGFGTVPHPTRPGFDPAGSSNASAFVVGREDLPIAVAIGTDTGGSISAPAGAVGLVGIVPPAGMISTKNMVPFATFLDRVGVLARDSRDAFTLMRYLSRVTGSDPHQRLQNPGALLQVSPARPLVTYLESLVAAASPEARVQFLRRMESYRGQGYEVRSLGPEWDFLAETPLRLWAVDAYTATAFTYANPLQRNRWDAPRRTLDENLGGFNGRLAKGALSLRLGFFDEAAALTRTYQELVRSKLGNEVVLVSPAAEAIRAEELAAGRAGGLLDGHDRITMAKNRIPEWGQITLPDRAHLNVGISLMGSLPDLMHFSGEVAPNLWRQRDAKPPPVSLPIYPMFRHQPPSPLTDETPMPRTARAASSHHESL